MNRERLRRRISAPCRVTVQIFFIRDGKYVVAYCPAFELSSYDTQLESAKSSFDEVMRIFAEETARRSSLETTLLELGWKLKQKPAPKCQSAELRKSLGTKNVLALMRKRLEFRTVNSGANRVD